jgi:adenylate cyclase
MMLGSTGLILGELRTARSHFQHYTRLCEARPAQARVVHQVVDPDVVCRCRDAWTLWLLGYADQALATINQALTLARATAHAFSLVFALFYAGIIHHYRREIGVAQAYVTAMLTLAREHEFVYYVSGGLCLQSLFLAKQGAPVDLASLREAVAAWHDQGAPFGFSALYAALAEVYYTSGQIAAGLQALDAALSIIQTKTERYYEAEVYRLRGACLLHPTALDVQQAEACLHRACALAESQHAKAWELRGVVSVSRLWHQQGKSVVARQRLAQIYGWFTEGLDTADLQEAQALLEELGG